MKSRFLSAVFLQFSGIVGSGIFVLPYLFHRSNFVFAATFFVFLAFISILINRLYLDIILHTPGDHQLAGYVKLHLGNRLSRLAVFNILLLSLGAIIAYQKLFSIFGQIIFPAAPSVLIFSIYLLLLIAVFRSRIGFNSSFVGFLGILTISIPLILYFASFSFPPLDLLTVPANLSFYGGALFALSGFTILPEVEELLRPEKSNQKIYLASVLGTVLAAIIMLIFSYSVIVLSRGTPSLDALTGLSRSLPLFAVFAATFGLLVVFKASLNFILILHEISRRDLRFPALVSSLFPFIFPLLSYSLHQVSFVSAISITGHITIFISALLICLIRLKQDHNFFTQFSVLLIMVSLFVGMLAGF